MPIRAGTLAPAISIPPSAGTASSGIQPVLVVGLGNPLLGDDGVGWAVIDALEARLAGSRSEECLPPVELERLAVGGLTLMERLVGRSRAILVDTITGGDVPCGTVLRLSLEDLAGRPSGHLDNAHDASLPLALDAGRALGAELPADIAVVAVEASRVEEFGDVLSPPVAAAIGPAVEAVVATLRGDPR